MYVLWQRYQEPIVVTALLLAYWIVSVLSTIQMSTTYDEIAHMTAGVSYWENHDYRLQPENGNLPQRWCALPLVLGGDGALPSADDPAWSISSVWKLGERYFYHSGHNVQRMLLCSRMAAACWGVSTCLMIYLWSRDLFGPRGGLLSLVVSLTDPAMLAHGPLATSDMCAAFFFATSTYSLWKLLQCWSVSWTVASALAIGGLFISKTSAPLILPATLIMLVVRFTLGPAFEFRWRGSTYPTSWRAGLSLLVLSAMVIGVGVYLCIWTAYGWRYVGMNPATLPPGVYFEFKTLDGVLHADNVRPFQRAVLQCFAEWRLLPEAYLYGTAYVFAKMRRLAFLCGEYSETGWWYYFPFTFLVKTPWATLIAMPLSLWAWFYRSEGEPSWWNPRRWYALTPLIVFSAIYWGAAITSTLNIGHRHLLPIYPLLFVLLGSLGLVRLPAGFQRALTTGLVAASLINAGWAYPHYLAYFNGLLSRDDAYQCLVDSNVDWGQDLPGLKRWLDRQFAGREPDRPVYLAYFGSGDPQAYGIEVRRLPDPHQSADPGWYCISATTLQGLHNPWTSQKEAAYQQLRGILQPFLALTADERRRRPGYSEELFQQVSAALRQAEFLRVLAGLRQRAPDENIGGSILIFQVSQRDLDLLLNGPAPKLSPSHPKA